MKKTTRSKTKSKNNGKNLVIVESPAKAKTINRYLGKGYVVHASMGHVRDLPTSTMGIDLENNFEPTYRVLPNRRKLISQLSEIAKKTQTVYLATDLDREGEAIAWHLAKALKLADSRVRRVIFNEITKPAIRNAFENAHEIDMDKVNAQQARRILDRIVGYQLSPLLWKNVAKNLSAGRVQSVAVRLVVERERDIEVFIPKEHWNIAAILHAGQKADAADAAYLKYEEHCKKTAKATADKAGQQLDRTDSSGISLGDVLKHPKTGQSLEVIGIDDPSLLRVRTTPGGQCQIGRKTIDQADVKHTEISAKAKEPPLQIKDDVKKLKAVFEKHQLFKADLVEFDGQAVDISTDQHADQITTALDGARYVITSLGTKAKRENPPPPFTTATLQRQAATRLSFTTKRTMNIAQQLYQGVELGGEGSVALITYMRTDSTHLAGQAVGAVRKHISEHFGEDYLPDKPRFYASSRKAQEAHEAIRPTDANRRPEDIKPFVSADQFKLYDQIWRRFVACQMQSATWSITEALVTASANQHAGIFKATGRQLVFPGFLAVLPNRMDGADAMLPTLAKDRQLHAVRLNATEHFTQPPARFNEASLVRTLEAQGIGRPSTYAAIISTIQDRGYVQKRGAPFYPTDLGTVVTDKLTKHFPKVMDVKFTSHMEDQLDKIEEAHLDWVAVLEEFHGPFKEALEHASENMIKESGQKSEHLCKQCGKQMVYRWTKTGRFLACSGYPECKYSCSIDDQGMPVEKEVKVTEHKCPTCGKPMILRSSRFGPFLGCSGYPDCKVTLPCDKSGTILKKVKPDEVKDTCDQCGKQMVARRARGRSFLACQGYPTCKNTKSLPEGIAIDWPGPELTDVKCEKCGKPMVIRRSRRGPFLGCSGYPKCRGTQTIKKEDDKAKTKAKTQKVTGDKTGGK